MFINVQLVIGTSKDDYTKALSCTQRLLAKTLSLFSNTECMRVSLYNQFFDSLFNSLLIILSTTLLIISGHGVC